MLAQTPVDAPETKPDNTPKAGPSGPTTNLTGPGSDAFGLGRGGGGGGYGGTGGGGGSRFGWFAGEVQRTIQEALGRNPTTRDASFSETVRVWADASGRVVRVRLVGSTGDLALDRALDEALSGVQLQDAPPSDMPMPIVMRLEARRPE
jgi:TonB family protein